MDTVFIRHSWFIQGVKKLSTNNYRIENLHEKYQFNIQIKNAFYAMLYVTLLSYTENEFLTMSKHNYFVYLERKL